MGGVWMSSLYFLTPQLPITTFQKFLCLVKAIDFTAKWFYGEFASQGLKRVSSSHRCLHFGSNPILWGFCSNALLWSALFVIFSFPQKNTFACCWNRNCYVRVMLRQKAQSRFYCMFSVIKHVDLLSFRKPRCHFQREKDNALVCFLYWSMKLVQWKFIAIKLFLIVIKRKKSKTFLS